MQIGGGGSGGGGAPQQGCDDSGSIGRSHTATQDGEERKRKAFQECLSKAIEPYKNTIRLMLFTAVGSLIKDSFPIPVSPSSQMWRLITLSVLWYGIKSYEPIFEEARQKAIADCRKETGYAGPI